MLAFLDINYTDLSDTSMRYLKGCDPFLIQDRSQLIIWSMNVVYFELMIDVHHLHLHDAYKITVIGFRLLFDANDGIRRLQYFRVVHCNHLMIVVSILSQNGIKSLFYILIVPLISCSHIEALTSFDCAITKQRIVMIVECLR